MNRLIIFVIIFLIFLATKGMLENINGEFYYCVAAFIELVTLFLISRIRGQLSIDMQKISVALISCHFIGWAMYHSYQPGIFYQILTYSLMSAQLIRLLWVGKNDGNTKSNFNILLVYRNYISGRRKSP